ncbi:GNAT family N-acetyltransferase [Actibacterium sp. 188UL27-1]|uniref:GNAT family N-acetyltransferase n=1 Tax=Actibacterium sp. 188UL27-1 TaxID=2786961 RepID=UPI00195F162D|nr:GNAT family protein [Actibacterium sp. 188UL27-1]MBM7067454.1 GNAT family N-acetyltransferase [Actibacterium sp. 188UL27-1]
MTDFRVTLRPPKAADADWHAALPISDQIHRMFGGDPDSPSTRSRVVSEGWCTWLRDQPFGRIIEADGRPVGEIRLHSVSMADQSASLAVGLLTEEVLGRGIGRRAIRQTLAHAFGTMGLYRVSLRVLAFNTRAIRCYRACGFRHEGTLRAAVRLGATRHDDWIMAILAPEFAQITKRSPDHGATPTDKESNNDDKT